MYFIKIIWFAETTLQNKIEKEKEVAQEQLILISDPYNHFEPRQAVIPLPKRNSMLQEAYGTHFGPIGKKKKTVKMFSRSSRLETHARSHSHIDTPPKHSLKVASSCAPTTRCSCPMILHEATDCQHTDHYPKESKAVLLSSTFQSSQLNNLGNPTESRNSPEPMAAPFQIHYLVSSQPSPMVLNSKGTVTHPQSGSNTQLSLKQTNLTKIISGCMSKPLLCLDL